MRTIIWAVGLAVVITPIVDAQTSAPANRSAASPTAAPIRPRRAVPKQIVAFRRPSPMTMSYTTALNRYRHERHNRLWWRRHFPVIVVSAGAYYYLDGSYWCPAWGYDPGYNYYDYDGPIYTYGNLLPDQVILNVQGALQELGYYGGSLSGSLSAGTRAAIAAFQRNSELYVTGVVDAPTVEALGLD